MEFPKRKQNRLSEFDYSQPTAYFVTVCTKNRANLFWVNSKESAEGMRDVHLTEYGRIARQAIVCIPRHYAMVSVDQYAVMPNHIHLLLQIHSDLEGRPMTAPTLANIVNQLKGTVSKRLGFPAWQKGFYDHVIRNDMDYQEVWKYIQGNPGKWAEDNLNT